MSPERPDGLRVALRLIEIFERLGIEYHLGGSYASSIHAVPRQTQDVDLVADLRREHLRPLLDALGSDFYSDLETAEGALARRASFYVIETRSGVKVDIFCLGEAEFDHAEFERAQVVTAFGLEPPVEVRVKSPEDTVLRKLHWYRRGNEVSERQWHDVMGCLRAQDETLDWDYMNDWARRLNIDDLLERARSESLR